MGESLKKKKIIFFSHSMMIGGIENALLNLLDNIDYNKYKVTLILENKEGELLNRINKNVNVKEYKVSYSKNIIFRKIYNYTKRIIFKIKYHNKYDFSCCYATYSVIGSRLSQIASKNSSLYVHSDYELLYPDDKDFYAFFDRLRIKKFNKIIFVSNESRKKFINKYNDLSNICITLNNYVDYKKIINLSKEKINITKRMDNLFVFVGRLDESSKKITTLIDIIEYLVKKNIKIELWIIGDGPDYQYYTKIVSEKGLNNNIVFLGKKINPYPYIKQADYVILTSKYEGFPVVYMESIVLNIPIITTIDVSDDSIQISNGFGYIISHDIEKAKQQVLDILHKSSYKIKKIEMNKINENKSNILEKIIND